MVNLKQNILATVFYSFLDLGLNKFIRLGAELLIIKLLARDELGLWGIASSYLIFFVYLSITPEDILLREYPKHRDDSNRTTSLISGYINFNLARNLLLFTIGVGVALFIARHNQLLAITFIAVLFQQLTVTFTELIKLIFYVNFQQKLVTFVNFATNIIFFFGLLLLFVWPSLVTYSAVLITTEIIFVSIWVVLAKTRLDIKYRYESDWLQEIKHNLKTYTLWQHFSGATTKFIYNIDAWVLSFYVAVSLIGDYTVALKIASYFFILPMTLQKTTTLHLSNKMNPTNSRSVLLRYLGLYGAIAIGQFIGFAIFGNWIVYNIFSKENSDLIFEITLTILIGVSILNLARPLIAFISVYNSIPKSFMFIYLPATIISISSYFYLISEKGLMGAAYANVVSYTSLFVLVTLFYLYFNHLKSPSQSPNPVAPPVVKQSTDKL